MKSYTQLARHSGNEALFEVVEMSILSMLWNIPFHLHVEGLRGTGKTTIMRAARQIMPPIIRVKGCLYNCDPEAPHCPNHKNLSQEELSIIGQEVIPRPFLEISHSAKIGTIAGSIDLQKITNSTSPEAAILPGIIPQANRGIIFVDEINRLADTSPEITDVLLDVMGTKPGRVQIEETGLPVVELPVQVSVWAASNPDEEPGPLQEIRRQLSDRFDLVIEMERTINSEAIAEVLAQSEQQRIGKNNNISYSSNQANKVLHDLERIATQYSEMEMPEYLRNYIARMYIKFGLESFRAIEAIQHAAILHCALRRRDRPLVSDILKVVPLALQHRVDTKTITKILNASDGNSSVSNTDTPENQDLGDTDAPNQESLVKETSFFLPLKGLFKKNEEIIKDAPEDPISASPLTKAKKLNDHTSDDLVKTDKDLE